ncbi:hypothetical protein NI17_010825 [Thermobifida halotolerans]|uniref:DUF8129 domain-containing protein n=1 Tax=Thermobifida halotolerans TaxID=483545 RepID=A0A399G8S7_9ACTN|nr:hypothetical protein [Thermobifida halotolerans]UOE21543.1 hypothetical protein NI17_010825 [Thermobifida halotolerans]
MPRVHRSDLVLPDYENLPLGTLQHRIRSLSEEQLRELVAYEEAHAQRTPVLELLNQRIRSLQEGGRPSSGDQSATPETAPPASGGSPVGEASQSPSSNPPPHGVPAQPARPKGDRQP